MRSVTGSVGGRARPSIQLRCVERDVAELNFTHRVLCPAPIERLFAADVGHSFDCFAAPNYRRKIVPEADVASMRNELGPTVRGTVSFRIG